MCTTPVPDNPDISDELHKQHIQLATVNRLNRAKVLIEQLADVSEIEQFLELYDDLLFELTRVRSAVNNINPTERADLPINHKTNEIGHHRQAILNSLKRD